MPGEYDQLEIVFLGDRLRDLRKLSDELGNTGNDVLTLTAAVSFYQMIVDWYAQGNRIEMITPARPETREDLVMP